MKFAIHMDIQNIKEELTGLYRGWYGMSPEWVERLAGSGSDRVYFRLGGPKGVCIGAYGANLAENRCFIRLSRGFRLEGVKVPQVYCENPRGDVYLQEDLGDVSLFSLLGTADCEEYVAECMRALVHLQTVPEQVYKDAVMCGEFCHRQVMWDLNYFKYEYLKPAGIEFDEERLEDDFERLAERLLSVPLEMWGFMYRDCQSRNVIIRDGEPWWIDFQGGRRGPCLYDAVSFLWQAKARFDADFRERMFAIYAEEFSKCSGVPKKLPAQYLDIFVLFRTLQVLGAYGFRGLVEKRAHFIESIPGALENLSGLLSKGVLADYPELEAVSARLVADERFNNQNSDKLRVTVFSFSYKKGYPADFSGNGGGYMFDCRAMHNPGRYAEYKHKTGLDSEVIEFLEERGEVQVFLEHAEALADSAVARYLQRGFSSLQIGFGCTGGQHRSVYCAEAMGRHLSEKFPEAEVVVLHREQGITHNYNCR